MNRGESYRLAWDDVCFTTAYAPQLFSGEFLFQSQLAGRRACTMRSLDVNNIAIKEELGKGGFGSVFLAKHGSCDIVLKKMMRTPSHRLEGVAKREYDLSSRLKHPNLVRMRHSFDTQTDHCLVMDVVEGIDLFRFMEAHDFSPIDEILFRKAFKGLCKGLEHSHTKGVAHLDIKPENIMVGDGGHLTLIDFGLATDSINCSSYRGSPEYAAPEVWRRTPYNPFCADVWSLGVVLYVGLTGCSPFAEDCAASTMTQTPKLEWPIELDISMRVKELVQWMMEYRPEDRPTVKDILNHKWLMKKSLLARISPRLTRKNQA
ncbi:hypothetical protein PROFUN_06085 [Planoprotostelium fungivorum]|uniref:non-specific serine/threonine protein kinase n=1 Tax=Planoprotostelium fungivorum TaxID=1890364 RepID=A0A2P6NPU1_9EUKA|nr:hypothetical protein PROFUN_06085 [Planoprotostelium fungivorum]